jgi:hypothetical protein
MLLPPKGYVGVEAAPPEYIRLPGMDPHSFADTGCFLISTSMVNRLVAYPP